MPAPVLRFHHRSCYTCRYYRVWVCSECLLLGRTLSAEGVDAWVDRARVCDGWKRRPVRWSVHTSRNPYFFDPYISRESMARIRRRVGLK
jgi:hypothetical protein